MCDSSTLAMMQNPAFNASFISYWQTLQYSTDLTALQENATSAAALNVACNTLSGFFCNQGTLVQLNFTSNATNTVLTPSGYISVCYPKVCCEGEEFCVLDTTNGDIINMGLTTSLNYLCDHGDKTFCASNEWVWIQDSCAMYSFVSFFLMVAGFVFVGILACACLAGLYRSVRLRRALDRRRTFMMDDYAQGLGELRQHLLAHHVRVYDSVQDAGKGFGDTCAICLDAWANGQEVSEFQPCGHMFHQLCITRWMEHRDTCPVCRTTWQAPAAGEGTSVL